MNDGPSRNDLSEDRTILANEWTFGSWMRINLGFVAIGVGFQGLFPTMQRAWAPRAIGTAFLLLAVLVIILAQRRAAEVIKRLDTHAIVYPQAFNLQIF